MKKPRTEKQPRKSTAAAAADSTTAVLPSPARTNGHTDGAAMHEQQHLLEAILSFRGGDFSVRLPSGWEGLYGKIADAFNDVLTMSELRARETARVSNVVGREGRLKQRMTTAGMVGGWADEVDAMNTLIDNLVRPTIEVTRTIGAVAKGD